MNTTTDPTRPDHETAAERAIIGEALFNPRTVRAAAGVITPDDFADKALGQVFALIVGMVASGDTVTPITVTAAIDGHRRAGHGDYRWPTLPELGALAASGLGTGITGHAKVVRDASIRRQAIAAGRRVIANAASGADPTTLAAAAIREFTDLRDSTSTGGFAMATLGEVLDGPDDYDWLIPGLLERGDRLVLTGAEGGGKTYWLRQIAILAAAGINPVTFRPIQPVRVCYVDVENSVRQWRRNARGIAVQAAHVGVDPRETLRLECTGRMNLLTDGDLAKVHQVLDDHQPELLVIGPLYKLLPKGINSDDDAAPLIAALDSLRERGVAMLMEAHAGHGKSSDGARDLRPRGSAALLGWPEFGLGLAPDATDDTLTHVVRWRGDRDKRDWPKALRRGGVWPWMNADMTGSDWHRAVQDVRTGEGRAA